MTYTTDYSYGTFFTLLRKTQAIECLCHAPTAALPAGFYLVEQNYIMTCIRSTVTMVLCITVYDSENFHDQLYEIDHCNLQLYSYM